MTTKQLEINQYFSHINDCGLLNTQSMDKTLISLPSTVSQDSPQTFSWGSSKTDCSQDSEEDSGLNILNGIRLPHDFDNSKKHSEALHYVKNPYEGIDWTYEVPLE